jgi:dolichyl-phosphate-mannose--protein O-mannosyl transferase
VSALAITALAALLRFLNLSNPAALVFDETYYVKDAYTLGLFGSERVWPENANEEFESGNLSVFTSNPSYVVHPPLGKWIIWLGLCLLGAESSFGWRFATALLGTLAVALIILIAKELTQSSLFSAIAGFLLAIEGQAIVLSRTGILDGILTFFVLLATLLLIKAIQAQRGRILEGIIGTHFSGWILLLGVALGMGASVKWSAAYFIVAYLPLTIWFDWRSRARSGYVASGAFIQGLFNTAVIAISSVGTYLLTWSGWILNQDSWGRQQGDNWLFSLFTYHRQILDFHTGLTKDHPYQASALEWLINRRPTAFYFEEQAEGCLGSDECVVAITAIPNLVIWFGGLLATLWLFRNLLGRQSTQLVLTSFATAFVPWLFLPERTTFQFYAVLISPFFVLALTLALQHYLKRSYLLQNREVREKRIALLLLGAAGVAIFYLPLWTALPVPYVYWRLQLFLPFWI